MMRRPRYESPALRASIKGQPCRLNVAGACQHIPHDPTVVPCHAPSEGKGGSVKSDDLFVVAGCMPCHRVLDGQADDPLTGFPMKREDREFYWRRGMQRQWRAWLEDGLIVVAGDESFSAGGTD